MQTHDRRTRMQTWIAGRSFQRLVVFRTPILLGCAAGRGGQQIYDLLLVYLVAALVPSLTACLASSPGRMRRTEVWTSRELRVLFLL